MAPPRLALRMFIVTLQPIWGNGRRVEGVDQRVSSRPLIRQ
jgi:hypothetical protein